ncbi:aromatic prenyltransferase [Aspergillus ambiguus]|uniref:putative dimethylallyl tryptophan synthase n=1 Tax=Aspergillus ambiguus TaxID=176160 RepID=UPI003CCD3E59
MTISSSKTRLTEAKGATNLNPCSVLSRYGCFSSEHEWQWWQDSGALMARFLEVCEYDLNEQYGYLFFLRQVVIPALGPYPPLRRSFLNTAKIGLELSVNYENSGHPTFRMTIDPTSADSGNRMDPFNVRTVDKIVDKLATMKLEGFDTVLHHRFMDEFIISDKQAETIYNDTTANERITTAMLAFDFKGGNMASRASGTCIYGMLRRALSRLDDRMANLSATTLVMEYLEANNHLHEIVFFAWDLVDDLSLAKTRDLWTLGGKLTGSDIEKGFELVEQLWNILNMGQRKPWLPFLVNYEIKPGQDQPIPKLYFPVDDGNDLEVAQAIARWFQVLGWHDRANMYVDNVRYLHRTSGLQTWVVFSFKETDPYTTIYYHPLASYPTP